MSWTRVALCASLGAVACAKGAVRADTHTFTATDEQAIRAFTKGLVALGADSTADAPKLAALLAEAGGPSFTAYARWADASPADRLAILANDTDFVCNATVKDHIVDMPLADRFRALVQACGAAYYGLPADQDAMLSEAWFVTQRAGAWIAAQRAKAAGHASLIDPLDAALKDVSLPMPPPNSGLPASSQSGWPVAFTYVVVSTDTVSVAVLPRARLAADGAHLADVPGGPYPGTKVSLDDLAATDQQITKAWMASLELAPMHVAPPDDPAPPTPPDDERMKKGGTFASLGTTMEVPIEAPLLIAAAQLPASRLIEVVRKLGDRGAWIAVVDGDGAFAAHHVGFGVERHAEAEESYGFAATPGSEAGVHVQLDDGGLNAWVSGSPELTKVDAATLGAWLDAHPDDLRLAVARIGLGDAVKSTASVRDLVLVLDLLAAHGVRAIAADADGAKAPAYGKYGTIGHGSGTGTGGGCGGGGYGIGSGGCGHGGRTAKQPQVKLGNITATGDLDKAIIRRYVRQRMAQLEYCYEKQLLAKPELAGTITAVFEIDANGAVASSAASGMGDTDVETCVASVVKIISFPKPKSGSVKVSYPISFSMPK